MARAHARSLASMMGLTWLRRIFAVRPDRQATSFAMDRRGAIAVISAMMMFPLVAAVAMVADVGLAYARYGALQQVADSAALAGALAYNATNSTAALQATVKDVVMANGWAASVIQSPTTEYLAASPQNSANAAVQVILVSPVPISFGASILNASSISLRVSSLVELRSQKVCILSLTTLTVNSLAAVDANGCSVAANSSILVNGLASLTGKTIWAGTSYTNNGYINPTPTVGKTVVDPYASLSALATAGLGGACQTYTNQATIAPGCWQNVNVNTASILTLQSGTYFFPSLNVNTLGSLIATAGTTIVIQNTFSLSGYLNITAPSTGAWNGVAVYAMQGMNANTGTAYQINGAIYSPTSPLNLNTITWNVNACTFIVAQSITFNSVAAFTLPQTNCSSYNFTSPSINSGGAVALTQ